MRLLNDELIKLSFEIWEWTKDGRSINDAPDDIKEKAERYKELYWQLKRQELHLMGMEVIEPPTELY